jgi:hypothetical protein
LEGQSSYGRRGHRVDVNVTGHRHRSCGSGGRKLVGVELFGLRFEQLMLTAAAAAAAAAAAMAVQGLAWCCSTQHTTACAVGLGSL